MIDFFRNLTKSETEKRQERLNAYLDEALTDAERRRFETELQQDADLRDELEALRWVKLSVQQAPRLRAPRNFILDPAVYGQSAPAKPSWSFYPGLRVATALTAFFFILALALDLATPMGALNQPLLGGGVTQTAMEEVMPGAEDAALMAEPAEPESETAQTDLFEAAPAPSASEEQDGDGPREMAPMATSDAGEAGATASEAADEVVEEELAVDAEGEVAAEESPEIPETLSDAPPERSIEATLTPDEAGEITALAPPEQDAAEDESRVDSAADAFDEETTTQDQLRESGTTATPFPYLLVIEVVLGVGLVILALVTLITRRGA